MPTDETHAVDVAPEPRVAISLPKGMFPDDQPDGPVHDNIFKAISATEGSIHRVRRETKDRRKNPGWAYKVALSDDETPESAVQLFGRPEGTPTRTGTNANGATIFAVWMNDCSAPTEEPEF